MESSSQLTESKMMQVLEWGYEKAIQGLPGMESAEELAKRYLEKYDIIKGYSDGTFRPDDAVTRAEFVTMAVRYYDLFNDVKKSDYTVNYKDLTKSYWAYSDIAYAKHIGWLNGYADGTFKGDNNITRAEVVTVTNHATNRTPDEDYINKNVSTLNKFTDLKNNSHWAYYDIMEAANTHLGVANKDAENWVK